MQRKELIYSLRTQSTFSHTYPIMHHTRNQPHCSREAEKREQIFTTALETDNYWRRVTRLNWQIISPAIANPAFLSTFNKPPHKPLNLPLETIPRLGTVASQCYEVNPHQRKLTALKRCVLQQMLHQIHGCSFKPNWFVKADFFCLFVCFVLVFKRGKFERKLNIEKWLR